MKKYINGRLITVVIVSILSLWFVVPTAKYFAFITGLPADEELTAEQDQEKRDRLAGGGMIKLGLDLQGGVEFLITLDNDVLRQRELQAVAETILEEFRTDRVDASVRTDTDAGQIIITDVAPDDVKIAREILDELAGMIRGNLDDLGSAPVIIERRSERIAESTATNIDAALRTIRSRVNAYGLTQPVVVKQPPDRILVQIPGETDPARVRQGLLRTANLEFRLLHPEHDREVLKFIDQATWLPNQGTGIVRDEFLRDEPVPGVEGAVRRVIDEAKVAALLPAGYSLFLGIDADIDPRTNERIEIENLAYVLRTTPELTGAQLRRADAIIDSMDIRNPHKVTLEFNRAGMEKFAEVTTDNVGRRFAIQLDGVVYSAPNIREPILYGRCEISGSFTQETSTDLALVLKAGSLPAPLRVINEQAIGASLGNDSVADSARALLIGAIALIIIMLYIYRTAGAFALFAMTLNVLLILAILSLANATLTLSGIGGILLTMGMAMDANVLIYERLREELAAGKSIRAAMNAAFGKAFSVILDSNVTTLLPALVLLAFEIVQDSVRGFWTAMAIGLIANLYTGLTVTRVLIETWVTKKQSINVGTFSPFKNVKIQWMSYAKPGFVASIALVALGAGYLFVNGLNPGIDFTGGVMANVEVRDSNVTTRAAVETALKEDPQFVDARVVKVVGKDVYQVTVPKHSEDEELEAIQARLAANLEANFPGDAQIASTQSVESIVGREFVWSAFFMVLVTSLVILGYVALRFRPIYGLGAVAALIHDVIMALAIFILLGRSLTLDIVSALLIILGYSVNDTIVVFDRIRETESESYGRTMRDVINEAINKTLSRTVFTSGTTFLAVLALWMFGGVGLKDFSLVLLLGIFFGTYSSIFVSAVVVYTYMAARERKLGLEKAHGDRTKTVKIGT